MEMQKAVLYLGVDATHYNSKKPVIHMPLVSVEPRPIDSFEIRRIFSEVMNYSHIIFTSKTSVALFFSFLSQFGYGKNVLAGTHIIAVGQITAYYLTKAGVSPTYIATDESQEGMIRTLAHFDLNQANILLPRSSSARPLLSHYLVEHGIRHQICTLYDMKKKRPYEIHDLSGIDEVVFTTILSVDVFFEIYREIPHHVKLHPIGPLVRQRLRYFLHVHKTDHAHLLDEKTTAYAC